MGCTNVLHEEKILKDGTSAAVLPVAVGSFRMKTISPEMSMRCVHLACKHSAECARLILKGGHGSTASPVDAKDQLTLKLLPVVARTHSARYTVKGTHSPDTDFRYLHGSPLASSMAPISKIVEVISSLDKSTGHLLPCLPDLQADVQEACVTALAMLVVVEEKISSQASEVADMSMKRSIIVNSALSIGAALSRDERGNPLLCKVQKMLSQLRAGSWRDHNIDRRSLSPLLRAAKDCVAVHDGSMSCVKLLLCFKTDMKVQDLRKHEPIHMAAFQDMCFNLNSASMAWDIGSLQENQVMNNESGARLLNDEFDYFNKSYTGVNTSACHWHFVSRKCSSEMAKSQCVLKQDFKFVPQVSQTSSCEIIFHLLAEECGDLPSEVP